MSAANLKNSNIKIQLSKDEGISNEISLVKTII